jgi:hypothetical protein
VASAASGAASSGSGDGKSKGQWICLKCDTLNSKRRQHCHKCTLERPSTGPAAAASRPSKAPPRDQSAESGASRESSSASTQQKRQRGGKAAASSTTTPGAAASAATGGRNHKPEWKSTASTTAVHLIGRVGSLNNKDGYGFIRPQQQSGERKRDGDAAPTSSTPPEVIDVGAASTAATSRRGKKSPTDGVYFRLGNAVTGGLPLQTHDVVQYRLQSPESNSSAKHKSGAGPANQGARADRVKLVALAKSRPRGELLRYVTDFVEQLEKGSPHVLQRGSECPVIWRSFAPPVTDDGGPPGAVATKLSELVRLLRRLIATGSKAAITVLQTLVEAGVFDACGHLCNSVGASTDDDSDADVARAHTDCADTCLVVFRHVPSSRSRVLPYVRAVAGGFATADRDRFLFSLLKAATISGEDITCLEWHDLPLVISHHEFEVRDDRLRGVRIKGGYGTAQEYFETYFRLLREDCFATLRDCVEKWRGGRLDVRDMKVFTSVRVTGMAAPNDRSDGGIILALDVRVDVEPGNKQLMFGNLVAISPNSGDIRRPLWAIVCARDDSREHRGSKQQQQQHKRTLAVELCTTLNNEDDATAIRPLLEEACVVAISPTFYRAYQPVLTSLQGMAHADVPFADELVHVKVGPPSALLESVSTLDARCVYSDGSDRVKVTDFLARLKRRDSVGTTFDPSQLAAVEHVLTNRVAIIQGPPGTGKTFIGTRLVRMLLSMRDAAGNPVVRTPIVVLTYKNHALDDFLLSCLSPEVAGEGRVGRIGGSNLEGSKLHACNVRSLVFDPTSGDRATRDAVNDVIRQSREAVTAARLQVETALKQLAGSHQFNLASLQTDAYTRHLQSLVADCPTAVFTKACRDAMRVLAGGGAGTHGGLPTQKDVLSALQRLSDADPASAAAAAAGLLPVEVAVAIAESLCQKWLDGLPPPEAVVESENALLTAPVVDQYSRETVVEDEAERMQFFENDPVSGGGRKGGTPVALPSKRGVRYDVYAVERPVASSRTSTSENARALLLNHPSIWKLTAPERGHLVAMVLEQQYETAAAAYAEAQTQYDRARAGLQQARNREQVAVLKDKAVVGMTITGASINRDLLLELQPSIVIVEEAAEVLEPQLLAALGQHVQPLIMIGDHQQLPPSVESHDLVVHYHFDVSMMERLIKNDLPFVTLTQQGRMRPELAMMLTDIYPDLTTNATVVTDASRPAPRCVVKSLFFWDHTDPEEGDRGYCNPGEADRAAKLALYFVSQGYSPSRITVLAAYARQVEIIRDRVAAGIKQVWTSEMTEPDRDVRVREIELLENNGKSSAQQRLDLALLLLSRCKGDDLNKAIKLRASGAADPRLSAVVQSARQIVKSGEALGDAVEKEGDDGGRAALAAAQQMFLLGRRHQIAHGIELAQTTFVVLVKALANVKSARVLAVRVEAEQALQHLRRDLNSVEVHTIDRFQVCMRWHPNSSPLALQPTHPSLHQCLYQTHTSWRSCSTCLTRVRACIPIITIASIETTLQLLSARQLFPCLPQRQCTPHID